MAISIITNMLHHSGAPQSPIALNVSDNLGVGRECEMVCSGVPFAKGALQPEEPMHVETQDGTALPTQTKVLGQWPDGSVKWLLVQFPADCPANERREYFLVHGQGPAPEMPLTVEDESDQITVDTGPLQVTVPKDNLTMFGDVCLQKDSCKTQVLAGGTPMKFVLEDGTIHTSANSKPDAVTLEEKGPLRATISATGWLQGPDQNRLYKLDTRLRFYAGQSYVQGDYTFICLGQPPLHRVKEISLDFSPTVGDAPRFIMPGDQQPSKGSLNLGQTAVLSVDSEMVCQVGLECNQTKAEKQLDGWGLLAGENGSVGVAVRDFWHLCPKAIELAPANSAKSNTRLRLNGEFGYIKLALWSERDGKILNLGRTRAKTHQVLYNFDSGQKDERAILNRICAFQEPLIATTEPEYFCSTDALGPLSPTGVAETAEYDRRIREAFEPLHYERETSSRENGMLHYGDYYHGGYGNELTRGDLEYDTGHACFLLYARSGKRDYYDFAVACNQHFIDMDINQETGDQRFHGYSERADTHEAVTTSLEWGHVFTDCPADAYYFTGDERSLDAVRMVADRTATIADGEGYDKIRDIFAGAERQLGWPLLALCRAYEVTQDEKYLQAASKVIEYIKMYAQNPLAAYQEGKWWRSWMMDGCKVFMTGQLHDGLAAYYNITHDEELRDVIVTSLNWLIDHMWNPQADGFVYEFNAMNRGHRQAGITGLNMLVVDAFRFGYQITGDRRYLSVATRAFWGQVRDMKSSDGKQFSQDARTSPHTAAYFYREHITPDNLPPSPQPITQASISPPAQPRFEILLRANFEGDLTCETPEGMKSGHVVGNIDFVPGKHGQAVAVGKNGYVWLPAPPDMLRRPGSIELWVQLNFKKNPTNPGQRAVFHIEGQTPLTDSLAACTIYEDLRIRMKNHVGHLDGTAEGAITDWEPGEWHHVVVTWDEKQVRLYLDGKEQNRPEEGKYAGDSVIVLPTGQQTKINLGWRFGNWYCDCAIDDLIVYGRTLTAEEVAAKYK
ncbi:glycoside hydrolase family 127 protein [bacterium]|nr:glycoside hydrolase family 127 protein [bacterium]